jgi:outer membrane protein assembly factor BamB
MRIVPGLWCIVVGWGMFALLGRADDWPQWRGPHRDGKSAERGLLAAWPAGGPPLVWQVKNLGDGYGAPAVAQGRIYLLSNEGLENERVQALSLADGSLLWSTTLGKVGNPDQRPSYPAARSTPTVDGQRLYALSSDGDLACVATDTGEVVWKVNLRAAFDGKPGTWAYAESPLVDGDLVICTPGGATATLVALRKQTGDVVWKCAVPEGDEAAYASPIVVELQGGKQYVQFLQKGLVGVDAATGKLLWRYDRAAQGSPANIPTPVARQYFVYHASSRGGAALVELQQQGTAVSAVERYFSSRLPSAIGGAVEVDGYLYGTNSQGLICAEFATGEVRWQNRSVGAASLLFADGRLYLHGESGEVALVAATPEGYRELGRFTPPDAPAQRVGKAWAYPVLANGKLLIRDAACLWCYDVQAR